MAEKNGKTRPFNAVNYSAARLARERQRREYEQQKKEKLIFVLFVVIILVMILFAILVFRNVLGANDPVDSDTDPAETVSVDTPDTGASQVSAPAYEDKTVAKSGIYAGHLLLIDSAHPFREETVNVTDIYNSRQKHEKADSARGYIYSIYPSDTTVMMEVEALKALNAMSDAFYKATGNYDLFVRLTAAYVEDVADEHATGRAVDLSGWAGGDVYYSLNDPAYTANFVWLTEHCHEYGFIRREADGACRNDHAYHFLYVGVPHAYYMQKNGLTLEAYLELLRTRHIFEDEGANNLSFTTDDGSRYEVYYVAATGDLVTLPIYVNNDSYDISGDNMSGFVITVKLK